MKTLFKIDVMESQFYTIFASRCVAGSIEKRIWIPLSLNNRAEVTQKHSPKANLPADARRPTPDARESKRTITTMSTSAIRRLAMAPLFAVLALLMATSLLHPVAAASGNRPFALGVRDSLMIGHSFHDHPAFGPAGGMVRAVALLKSRFSPP